MPDVFGRWAVRTGTVEAGSHGPFLLISLHPEVRPSVDLSVSGLTPSLFFFLRTFGCPLVTHSRGLNARGHIYIYIYIYIYITHTHTHIYIYMHMYL